jgi:hypothetical protein
MSAYRDIQDHIFATRCSPRISYFEAFQAPEHGWYIDENRFAHKCGLRCTSHALHYLVRREGWRGAERVLMSHKAQQEQRASAAQGGTR